MKSYLEKSRYGVMTFCAGAVVAFLACIFFQPMIAFAGEQADIAISAARKLVAEGNTTGKTVITIAAKQGNIDNFWGINFELKNEWEQKTGVSLDIITIPQQPLLMSLKKDLVYDVAVAQQREYADLLKDNIIADLTPYIKKFGFKLDDKSADGYVLPDMQMRSNNKVVAIPADGDITVMFFRKDLMEDETNRAAFKKKYNRELRTPDTWDEYQQLVEFFHGYREGFYGCGEHRDPLTGWMYWMPRYTSQAAPNQYLFDDNMHPLINSPAGINATKSYLATIPFSPPDILKEGNHYSYVIPLYKKGDVFAYFLTNALAKVVNGSSSAVKDKFIVSPMPGTIVGNKLVRRPCFIFGNNLVINEASKNKELAFLYAMWLTDPENSTRSIMVLNGIADPYRFNHLTDKRLSSIYSQQALDNLKQQIPFTAPSGTGLPGDKEYFDVLNKNLWKAAKGEQTAQEAMDKTAAEWEKITDKYGRNEQIAYWRAFKAKYPTTVVDAPKSHN